MLIIGLQAPCDILFFADGDGHDDDEKAHTDNIDILEDFAKKTNLGPPMDKGSSEQEREGVVANLEDQEMGVVDLDDQQMEDVNKQVLLVVGKSKRKRGRIVGEDNSMDKVVDRVKRKNPQDVRGIHTFELSPS